MNHRAKFDAASFIIAGEIRNRANKQTNKQTVNDISTLCLSACVDNNVWVLSVVRRSYKMADINGWTIAYFR